MEALIVIRFSTYVGVLVLVCFNNNMDALKALLKKKPRVL